MDNKTLDFVRDWAADVKRCLRDVATDMRAHGRDDSRFETLVNRMPDDVLDKAAALRATGEGGCEPIGWVFQHDETGRVSFCENDGVNDAETFASSNPRYVLCGPAYSTPWPNSAAVDRAISWFAKTDPDEARLAGVSKDCATTRQFFSGLLRAAAPTSATGEGDREAAIPAWDADPRVQRKRALAAWEEATQAPTPAEPLRDAGAVYQLECDDTWIDVDAAGYYGHDGSNKRILYAHPAPQQPAITDAMVEKALEGWRQHQERCRFTTVEGSLRKALEAALTAAQEVDRG